MGGGLLVAGALILAGCSFDANELKAFPESDSSAALDVPSAEFDGPTGILDSGSEVGPEDSSIGADGWFDGAGAWNADIGVVSRPDSAQPFSTDSSIDVPTDRGSDRGAVIALDSSLDSSLDLATACSPPAAPVATATNSKSTGSITIAWAPVGGSTGYAVYRSTSSGGPYTPISTNQTASSYTDPASGLTNGTTYYYKVSASNANGQCVSAQSSAASAMSCTIPTAPAGFSATRSGNKQALLVWTNSTGATAYNILRSTASGTGYVSVGTATASPYADNTVANGTAYYYFMTANSDAGGKCSSSNSAQGFVPACTVATGNGTATVQAQGQTTDWCIVTCDDNIGWWSYSAIGSRKVYVNAIQQYASGAMPLPAQQNSGYAFYFSAGGLGNGDYATWSYGNGTGRACP